MRVPVVLLAFAAIFVTGSPAVAAEDGGDDGSVDAEPAESSTGDAAAMDATSGQPDVGILGDGGESGAAVEVIACDGALCDTAQGRPTCALASPPPGRPELDPMVLAGMVSVLGLGLVRRVRRGT